MDRVDYISWLDNYCDALGVTEIEYFQYSVVDVLATGPISRGVNGLHARDVNR